MPLLEGDAPSFEGTAAISIFHLLLVFVYTVSYHKYCFFQTTLILYENAKDACFDFRCESLRK